MPVGFAVKVMIDAVLLFMGTVPDSVITSNPPITPVAPVFWMFVSTASARFGSTAIAVGGPLTGTNCIGRFGRRKFERRQVDRRKTVTAVVGNQRQRAILINGYPNRGHANGYRRPRGRGRRKRVAHIDDRDRAIRFVRHHGVAKPRNYVHGKRRVTRGEGAEYRAKRHAIVVRVFRVKADKRNRVAPVIGHNGDVSNAVDSHAFWLRRGTAAARSQMRNLHRKQLTGVGVYVARNDVERIVVRYSQTRGGYRH